MVENKSRCAKLVASDPKRLEEVQGGTTNVNALCIPFVILVIECLSM